MASQLLPLGEILAPARCGGLSVPINANVLNRAHRQVRRVEDLGRHEGRQGSVCILSLAVSLLMREVEFSGTLLGFDDYVSE